MEASGGGRANRCAVGPAISSGRADAGVANDLCLVCAGAAAGWNSAFAGETCGVQAALAAGLVVSGRMAERGDLVWVELLLGLQHHACLRPDERADGGAFAGGVQLVSGLLVWGVCAGVGADSAGDAQQKKRVAGFCSGSVFVDFDGVRTGPHSGVSVGFAWVFAGG